LDVQVDWPGAFLGQVEHFGVANTRVSAQLFDIRMSLAAKGILRPTFRLEFARQRLLVIHEVLLGLIVKSTFNALSRTLHLSTHLIILFSEVNII
jgi:hypothetical protein